MKAKFIHTLAILLVAAVAVPALADQTAKKEGQKKEKKEGAKKKCAKKACAKCPSAALTKGAKLTADQKKEVKQIVADNQAAVKKAKAAGDKDAMKKARGEFRTAILAVLTADQKTAIKEARKAAKAKAKEAKEAKADKPKRAKKPADKAKKEKKAA